MNGINILDLSCRDSFALLAADRVRSGLECMRQALIQEKLSPEIDAVFWPELSLTRNAHRWRDGGAYGFLLVWTKDSVPFVPLSFRPNACGVLVAVTSNKSLNDLSQLLLKLHSSDYFEHQRTRLRSEDLSHRNHFILVGSSIAFPSQTVLLIHTCPSGSKLCANGCLGLYPESSPELLRNCKTVTQNNVNFRYLVGDIAQAYHMEFQRAEAASLTARRELAEYLLGSDFRVVANFTHQGLRSYYMMLGCSDAQDYGIILGNDCGVNARLFHGIADLRSIGHRFNWSPSLPDTASLKTCPHGLGIRVANRLRHAVSAYDSHTDLFVFQNTQVTMWYADPNNIPFEYRDVEVMNRICDTIRPSSCHEIETQLICKL